jgi:hypothetical protein
MPYIIHSDREVAAVYPKSAGELNYAFTDTIIEYMKQHNNYQGINDVLGALEGAKMEFYRRWVVPYEDYKCASNGDVYPTGED